LINKTVLNIAFDSKLTFFRGT